MTTTTYIKSYEIICTSITIDDFFVYITATNPDFKLVFDIDKINRIVFSDGCLSIKHDDRVYTRRSITDEMFDAFISRYKSATRVRLGLNRGLALPAHELGT